MKIEITAKDISTRARSGKVKTSHGEFETPAFMPVGTQATVKTLSNDELKGCGVQILLSNAYHLYLRPGTDIIRNAGGLHRFMNWDRPILTDSGGFQVFSLAVLRKVTDEGVEFQSHIDGSKHFLTPRSMLEFQTALGSDIMMVLDECVHYPCEHGMAKRAVKRTLEWARLSKTAFADAGPGPNREQHLFGIVQGASYEDLRKECAEELAGMNFDGYALGGLAVGEPREITSEITDFTVSLLPEDKPRYLMGVGEPRDILEAVSHGIDMFDCVVPTRNGRNGTAFTSEGRFSVRTAVNSSDLSPIEEGCGCYACRNHTRSYIRHLFNTDEILGLKLVSLHNIYFYQRLMRGIRQAIKEGKFTEYKNERMEKWTHRPQDR